MADVFHLDETPTEGSPRTRSAAASSSAPTPPPEPHEHIANDEIAVERRVVPLLEFSDDTCPVCLDEFTTEDPGAPTVCQ